MKLMVRANLISNCPVIINDINASHKKIGPNIISLKEKTARKQPEAVMTGIVSVPSKILHLNQQTTIYADVMFFNRVVFVVSISQGIKFLWLSMPCSGHLVYSLNH